MTEPGGIVRHHFTSVTFANFKTFKHFSISLVGFNVLVGPNNSGKSTIISVFRILAEAMRKARARNPELLHGPHGQTYGYRISLGGLQVSTANVFSDYDESKPATVKFRLSTGSQLLLYFPEPGHCILIPEADRSIRNTTAFKSYFNCEVAFVPVLGPVEFNEPLYQPAAARQALITNGASRNFRNIWYHFPERFPQFRDLLRKTWPGMDIERPTLEQSGAKPVLNMFCVENRIPRELCWAGFGFQVWCQMLTYILEGTGASLLAIDEPDIYLHSDLQRQLLRILKELGPDILIATHSTELVVDSEPNDIVVVAKGSRSARRLRDPSQLQSVFAVLGSNLNPTLTQLAKTKRALFVEGADFHLIALFAAKLGKTRVANRSHFAVIAAEGFNPARVRAVADGIDATLGTKVIRGAIFDRDFRSDAEADSILAALSTSCKLAKIHSRKEIENYLLVPAALDRAIGLRIADQNKRGGRTQATAVDAGALLDKIVEDVRLDSQSQFVAAFVRYYRTQTSEDPSVLTRQALLAWEQRWSVSEERRALIPGKAVLARLNSVIMDAYGVSVSTAAVIRAFTVDEVVIEMKELIDDIDRFCDLGGGGRDD